MDKYAKELRDSRRAVEDLTVTEPEKVVSGEDRVYYDPEHILASEPKVTRRLEKRFMIKDPGTPEAAEVQVHLKNLGYDLGDYGVNKDGIDGIIGRKTTSALKDYFDKQSKKDNR